MRSEVKLVSFLVQAMTQNEVAAKYEKSQQQQVHIAPLSCNSEVELYELHLTLARDEEVARKNHFMSI